MLREEAELLHVSIRMGNGRGAWTNVWHGVGENEPPGMSVRCDPWKAWTERRFGGLCSRKFVGCEVSSSRGSCSALGRVLLVSLAATNRFDVPTKPFACAAHARANTSSCLSVDMRS